MSSASQLITHWQSGIGSRRCRWRLRRVALRNTWGARPVNAAVFKLKLKMNRCCTFYNIACPGWICMTSQIFQTVFDSGVPTLPSTVLVMKGYLYNCNMSNLTWCPHDQKSGYAWQWYTSGVIWQLWWQWHRVLTFWTTSLFHVTIVLRHWHLQQLLRTVMFLE